MLLVEIMDNNTDIRVDTRSPDISRLTFTVGDTEYTVTAHSVPDHEGEWFMEMSPQRNMNPEAKPRTSNDVFKIVTGVHQSIQLLLKNYPQIETLVFSTKDTSLGNMINRMMNRRPLPGWRIADQKNGWFRLVRE